MNFESVALLLKLFETENNISRIIAELKGNDNINSDEIKLLTEFIDFDIRGYREILTKCIESKEINDFGIKAPCFMRNDNKNFIEALTGLKVYDNE